MKKVEGLKYCQFVYLGIDKISILKWYFINILTFNYWSVVVITPAAGREGGRHIDIYNLRSKINKKRELLNKLRENKRGEEIYLFSFFDFPKLTVFFFRLRKKKGGVLPGQHPP
ncbi:MAG: hypothetical protein V3574_00795 [Candidatus Moraniibacteriota bacterium]